MKILKQQEKSHRGFCFGPHLGSHMFETGGVEKHTELIRTSRSFWCKNYLTVFVLFTQRPI